MALKLSDKERAAITYVYTEINKRFPKIKLILANYFDCFGENLETVLALPVHTLHLDLVRCHSQLDDILKSGKLSSTVNLSLGVVDGRNIWKNDFKKSLVLIQKAMDALGENRILIASSCSLIHSPCDLDLETNDTTLTPEIKQWLAFAKQKIEEIVLLQNFASGEITLVDSVLFQENKTANENRKTSKLIHNDAVKNRVASITTGDDQRENPFPIRRKKQIDVLNLP